MPLFIFNSKKSTLFGIIGEAFSPILMGLRGAISRISAVGIISLVLIIIIELGFIYTQNKIPPPFRWFTNFEGINSDPFPFQKSERTNPFNHNPGRKEMMFDPVTGLGGIMCRGKYDSCQADYFGFRNPHGNEIYYQKPGKDRIIVVTGNSESMGYNHRISIAENLQNMLEEKGFHFKVLNLAVNSHSSPHELNTYIHYAYELKPEFVISHSGGVPASLVKMIPEKFRQLGLFYHYTQVDISRRYYFGKFVKRVNPEEILRRTDSNEDAEIYLKFLKKYNYIVKNNHGHFILGLQKIFLSGENIGEVAKEWHEVPIFYKRLNNLLPEAEIDFIDFNSREDLSSSSSWDAIHSTSESAVVIAEIYAEHIIKILNQR
jgi:hypothetical protein